MEGRLRAALLRVPLKEMVSIEIRPASITQLSKGREGRYIQIDDDVQGVANGLAEVDPHIKLRFSEGGGHFVIYWSEDPNLTDEDDDPNNTTYLIFTAQELDHRIVHKMQEVYAKCNKPGYSFADELEAKDAADKKAEKAQRREQNGEIYERMAHAMRKDLGYDQSRIYIPETA